KTTTTSAKSTLTRSGNRNNRTGKDYWINEYIQRIAYIERCKERFPGKDNAFFKDEINQLNHWKKVIEESSERDVLGSKESLEQRFNDEKRKYEEKVKRRDILINKREISKLEDKLAKLERDNEAMQLDNDEKEQKIILLENEIASLPEDGSAKYYKDLYNITIEENIRLKDQIEELQNELDAIKKNVVNYDSLKKEHEKFQKSYDEQMKEQFKIEDYIRIQLEDLKRENEKLESLLRSGNSFVNNPSQ
ncbi:22684_t:CDS:2, partial [Gigaspora margarita]